MKIKLLGICAIVIAISASAFTTKWTTSTFFVYTGPDFTQSNIQNINNYAASSTNPCSTADANVCGVTLPHAENLGSTPLPADFTAESTNLWTSQQNGSPSDTHITMKN
jgi:hypothetical protein